MSPNTPDTFNERTPQPAGLSRMAIGMALFGQTACNSPAPQAEKAAVKTEASDAAVVHKVDPADASSSTTSSTTGETPEESSTSGVPEPTLYYADPSLFDASREKETREKIAEATRVATLFRPHGEGDWQVEVRAEGCENFSLKWERDQWAYEQTIDTFMAGAREICGPHMPENVNIINGFVGTSWNVVCKETIKYSNYPCPELAK